MKYEFCNIFHKIAAICFQGFIDENPNTVQSEGLVVFRAISEWM